MEYVRRRRMAFAASELSRDRRIIDIALDYGFDTHNGFSKAFRREYGICFPHDVETGKFTYAIGVKVDNYDNASEDMFKGEVPEATYAVFTTPPADYAENGFVKAIEGTWKYIFERWFPNSGYEFASEKVDFEFYDERCHGDKGVVMDIYIPIIKK